MDLVGTHGLTAIEDVGERSFAQSCPVLGRVVAGYALDAADGPLLTAEHRTLFPFGQRWLREETRLHWHVVFDNDFLTTNWLADGAKSMAHDGDDGDLHRRPLTC
jgi:hypothetical protein